jgi:hypothetical protein
VSRKHCKTLSNVRVLGSVAKTLRDIKINFFLKICLFLAITRDAGKALKGIR